MPATGGLVDRPKGRKFNGGTGIEYRRDPDRNTDGRAALCYIFQVG